jgi:hypothetical protein
MVRLITAAIPLAAAVFSLFLLYGLRLSHYLGW